MQYPTLRHSFVIFLSFSLLTFVPVGFLEAKKKTTIEIKHKSRDLQKVTAELQKKRQEQQKLKEQTEQISKEVKQKETKIYDIEKSLLFTMKKTSEIKQQLAESTLSFEAIEHEEIEDKEKLKESVQMYYVASRLQSPYSPMSSYSRQIIQSQVRHIGKIRDKKTKAGEDLKTLTNSYQLYRQEAENQHKQIGSLKTRRQKDSDRLKKFRSRQDILKSELKELETTAQELASLIDLLRSRARKEKEAEKKARLEKSASGESPIPRHSLPWPVYGKIKRSFGRQKHPTLGTPYISKGILIHFDRNQSVRGVADGNVLYAGQFMSYGPMVVIEHPGDWFSVYGNMARWTVEKGQELKRGDVVGWSGVSASGVHETYFELRFYGKATNPIPWLEKNAPQKAPKK